MNIPLRIVAGESIPFVQDAFSTLGTLTMLPGRSITAAEIQHTDVLLVRSITKIQESLLQDSSVEFVGSASAGIDHIDTTYLNSRNIGFASSPGSNANAVAEYVITALLIVAQRHNQTLAGKTIGIVGVGHIGKLIKQKAEVLGMTPILNDPFLANTEEFKHQPLEDALRCDIVTFHVPLTKDGPYPTYHLINEHMTTYFRPSTIVINASRGEVIETQALLNAITQQRVGPTVIDVWEQEPHISWDLFDAVTIGTPHIAGHSLDGKAAGTFMIYAALCQHVGIDPIWNPALSLPAPTVPSITVDASDHSNEEHLRSIATKVYNLEADYDRMKQLQAEPLEERANLFDALRKNYPIRREFHGTKVLASQDMKELQQILTALGFLHD